jgi:hypothetical protein
MDVITSLSSTRTALVRSDAGLGVRRIHTHHRLHATVRSTSLDARLASGSRPESRWLLAVRAAQLVEPRHRALLADAWDRVLLQARGAGRRAPAAVPVQRGRVLAAAEQIADLVAALRRPGPMPARGVALADVLLTDGAGPVYSARSNADLATLVADAVRAVSPERAAVS